MGKSCNDADPRMEAPQHTPRTGAPPPGHPRRTRTVALPLAQPARREVQPPDAGRPVLCRLPLPRTQTGDRTRRLQPRHRARSRREPRPLDDARRLHRAALRQCRGVRRIRMVSLLRSSWRWGGCARQDRRTARNRPTPNPSRKREGDISATSAGKRKTPLPPARGAGGGRVSGRRLRSGAPLPVRLWNSHGGSGRLVPHCHPRRREPRRSAGGRSSGGRMAGVWAGMVLSRRALPPCSRRRRPKPRPRRCQTGSAPRRSRSPPGWANHRPLRPHPRHREAHKPDVSEERSGDWMQARGGARGNDCGLRSGALRNREVRG